MPSAGIRCATQGTLGAPFALKAPRTPRRKDGTPHGVSRDSPAYHTRAASKGAAVKSVEAGYSLRPPVLPLSTIAEPGLDDDDDAMSISPAAEMSQSSQWIAVPASPSPSSDGFDPDAPLSPLTPLGSESAFDLAPRTPPHRLNPHPSVQDTPRRPLQRSPPRIGGENAIDFWHAGADERVAHRVAVRLERTESTLLDLNCVSVEPAFSSLPITQPCTPTAEQIMELDRMSRTHNEVWVRSELEEQMEDVDGSFGTARPLGPEGTWLLDESDLRAPPRRWRAGWEQSTDGSRTTAPLRWTRTETWVAD